MRSLELQGYTWRPRITFNRSKLQRPDRVTVCSHSARDATANVETTLYIPPTSELVKIALKLNITTDCSRCAPQFSRIVMEYAGFGGKDMNKIPIEVKDQTVHGYRSEEHTSELQSLRH